MSVEERLHRELEDAKGAMRREKLRARVARRRLRAYLRLARGDWGTDRAKLRREIKAAARSGLSVREIASAVPYGPAMVGAILKGDR